MKYDIFGSYKLPRAKNGLFASDRESKRQFWADLEDEESGLSSAAGCYIVAVRNRVWYVGMAEKQSFKDECFTPHKITKINQAIAGGKGDAYLLLIARRTPVGRFSKPSKNGIRDIRQLELLLMGVGLDRNTELLNKKDTKILRESVVPGFLNSPKGCGNDTSVKDFRKIMGA